MKKYRQPKINIKQKIGSFAFFLAWLLSFALAYWLGRWSWQILATEGAKKELLTLFAYGFVSSMVVFAGFKALTLRTFIHELKHALVILLSGNRLTDFQVSKGEGHVSYNIYAGKQQFGAFIALAPYYFPLFSLPMLIACVVFEGHAMVALISAMGVALGTDLITSYQEIHPHQSDLMRIRGGRIMTYSFILGANLFWTSICMLWVIGGRDAYIDSTYELLELIRNYLTNIEWMELVDETMQFLEQK